MLTSSCSSLAAYFMEAALASWPLISTSSSTPSRPGAGWRPGSRRWPRPPRPSSCGVSLWVPSSAPSELSEPASRVVHEDLLYVPPIQALVQEPRDELLEYVAEAGSPAVRVQVGLASHVAGDQELSSVAVLEQVL